MHEIRLGGLIWCMTAPQGHGSGAPVLGRLRRAEKKRSQKIRDNRQRLSDNTGQEVAGGDQEEREYKRERERERKKQCELSYCTPKKVAAKSKGCGKGGKKTASQVAAAAAASASVLSLFGHSACVATHIAKPDHQRQEKLKPEPTSVCKSKEVAHLLR